MYHGLLAPTHPQAGSGASHIPQVGPKGLWPLLQQEPLPRQTPRLRPDPVYLKSAGPDPRRAKSLWQLSPPNPGPRRWNQAGLGGPGLKGPKYLSRQTCLVSGFRSQEGAKQDRAPVLSPWIMC